MKRLVLALLALLVFSGAVLAFLPASLALRLLPADSPLQLHGVRGSIWSGSVAQVRVQDRLLGGLAWQVLPLGLLRGGLEADVQLVGEVSARGRVERRWSSLHVRDAEAELPAAWIEPVLASPALRPQGELRLRIHEAELRGGQLQSLRGELLWQNAAVSGAVVAALGDLQMDFASDATGRIQGHTRDLGGPLQLDGGFHVERDTYRAELRLVARDARIEPALRWLGQPQDDGSRLLILYGKP